MAMILILSIPNFTNHFEQIGDEHNDGDNGPIDQLLLLILLWERLSKIRFHRKIVDYVNYMTSAEQIAEYVKLFR